MAGVRLANVDKRYPNGYVAARDWGCKIGAFEKGCPVMDARPPRADIPA